MGRELAAVQRALGEGWTRVTAAESVTPAAQPATVPEPAGVAVDSPVPRTERDHAESTDRWPSRGAATAWDTSEPSASRAPRIAIATGVAIAAIMIAAVYYWQMPSAPPRVTETPAAPTDQANKASEERPPAGEMSLPSATNSTKTDREIKTNATEAPASPTPAPVAPASPPASKTDRPSPPPRERDKAPAVAKAPSGPREDAEQARLRMAEAKRAAERVAAEFFARKRFEAAQGKERDGMTALGKSDYAAAIGRFTEARAEYQAALQEVPAEEEKERQRSLVQANLDQAHAAAATRRQEALAAEADKVARDVFDQAQAKQVEGDNLVGRKNLAAATRAYQEAADRYGEAVVRARAVRGR
jgi:hypothetical protein